MSGGRRSPTFKTPGGETKYIAAYQATLTLWTIPYEPLDVVTSWGRTHLVVCGPEDGPPLVLLHGMNLSATMWFSNVSDLGRHYRIYAVDTIGSIGQSVAVHPLRSSADLVGWLEDVLDGLGVTRTHVVGHSHGGWLGLNLALNAPERVDRLVLLAPLGLQPLVSQFWLRGIPMMMFPRRALIAQFMDWMTEEGFTVNRLFVDQFVLGVQTFRPWPQIRVLPTPFADDELGRVKAPTLVLAGEKEVLYDPEAAVKRAKQRIRHAEAQVVPHASHGLPMERAEWVNERILTFLKQEQT